MKKFLILVILGLSFAFSSMAQEHIEKRYTLFYRVNKSDVDTTYMGNGRTIRTMIDDIRTTLEVDGTVPDSLIVYASTSPEGPAALNERLAIQRAQTARALLVELFPQYDPAHIKVESRANDWSGLILTLRRENSLTHGAAILKVLTDPTIENKDAAVRAMPDAYAEIRDGMFNYMRTASIAISVVRTETNVDEFAVVQEMNITSKSPIGFPAEGGEGKVTFDNTDNVVPEVRCDADWLVGLAPTATGLTFRVLANPVTEPRSTTITLKCYGKTHEVVVNQEPAVPVVVEPEPEPVVEKPLPPFYMAVKTNMLYDLAIVPNIGVEFYLGKNFSVAGNWMYSWWKSDPKAWYWRTYGGDLAVRWWFGEKAQEKPLQGHHVGLYGQIVTYDFEVGGRGYLGDRWSYAGGVEYGYSLPIARRLNIDFNLGVGYLGGEFKEYLPIDGHYVWQVTKQRHWFGPTKAEISLVWLLGRGNVNEGKGGKR